MSETKHTSTTEVLGVHIAEVEEDYIDDLVVAHGASRITSMARLIKESGAESIEWSVTNALSGDADPNYESYLEEYRKATGRQYPRVYRWKVTIEAEPLSEEETVKFWQEYKQQEQALSTDDDEPVM